MYSGDANVVKELIAKAMPGTYIEVRIEDLGAYIAERIAEREKRAETPDNTRPPDSC